MSDYLNAPGVITSLVAMGTAFLTGYFAWLKVRPSDASDAEKLTGASIELVERFEDEIARLRETMRQDRKAWNKERRQLTIELADTRAELVKTQGVVAQLLEREFSIKDLSDDDKRVFYIPTKK